MQRDCGNKDLEELVQDLLPRAVLIETLNSFIETDWTVGEFTTIQLPLEVV